MSLSISKRPCELGRHLNGRLEFHGEDNVGAVDFAIKKVMLKSDEVDELLGAGAYARLFVTEGNPIEPFFRGTGPIVLDRKFESSSLTLELDDQKLKLANGKLARITLIPRTGGICEMSLQFQVNPDPEQQAMIWKHMGEEEVNASIRFGRESVKAAKDQPELPLTHDNGGTPEAPAPVVN